MLFRLVKAPGSNGGILGFDWIEVIAAIPRAIHKARTEEDYEEGLDGVSAEWTDFGIEHEYICRTEHGLTKLANRDLWDEIYEGTYIEERPN